MARSLQIALLTGSLLRRHRWIAIALMVATAALIGLGPSLRTTRAHMANALYANAQDQPSIGPPAPCAPDLSLVDEPLLCLEVYDGTVRSILDISNPAGLGTIPEYHLSGLEQKVISRTATSARVEITSTLSLSSHAAFPVPFEALPDAVRSHLEPVAGFIQADDPLIVALASDLTRGATREATAVERILSWMRGNVRCDTTCGPAQDALSVLERRCGNDAGHAALSTALLRAAGIPARRTRGCVAPQPVVGWQWTTEARGAWHWWIEVYYPDLGWAPSDPQRTVNWLDTAHITNGFAECQLASTTIATISHTEEISRVYSRQAPYSLDPLPEPLIGATAPTLEKALLEILPAQAVVLVTASEPSTTLRLDIRDDTCEMLAWRVQSSAPWLTPGELTGTGTGSALFEVDATSLALGTYHTALIVSTTSPFGEQSSRVWEVPVTLHLVPRVKRQHLPIMRR